MSDAVSSVGVVFMRDSSTVAEVRAVDWGGKSRTTHRVTPLDASNGYDVFVAGFRDPGEVTLTMNFTASGYTDIETDYDSNTAQTYQIVINDSGNTEFEFEAYVTNLGVGIPEDGGITMPVTLKITGQPTMTS
ncbi:MAG: hypothetical protein ACTSYH_03555 [Candidatus Heimdallarchaeaceae archaeon]